MSAPAPKPFTLQSPEHIAQEYGGNKQKIAQAVQMGIVDPTSGLMAGMFIDRMRAAQAQEQAPQQTVAQQVLGPRPSQMPPQGGLGGLPPGGPPPGAPPRQMASAAPPPGGPPPQGPVGMAEGGLTTLPVPDYMFDEHTFAGGGIVAFAKGDYVNFSNVTDAMNALSVSKDPQERAAAKAFIDNYNNPQQNTPTPAAPYDRGQYSWLGNLVRGQGALGPNAAPEAGSAADVVTNMLTGQGMTSTKPAPPPTAAPPAAPSGYQSNLSTVDLAPFDPNASVPGADMGIGALTASLKQPTTPLVSRTTPPTNIADIIRSAATAKNVPTPTPRPDLPTDAAATPEVDPLDAYMKKFKDVVGDVPAPPGTSDADKAARKKEDMWSALAQAGFGMMAGTSPNALTNIGEGFKAAMPTIQESLKQQRADEKEDKKTQYEYALAQQGLKGKQLDYAVGRVDKAEAAKQKDAEDAENKRWHDLSIEEQKFETQARADEAAAQLKQSAINTDRMLLAQTPAPTTYATNAVTTYMANLGRPPKPGEREQVYNKALDDLAKKQADDRGTQYAAANKNAIAMVQIGGPLAAEFAKAPDKTKYLMDLTDTLARRAAGPENKGLGGAKFLGFE